MKPNDIGVLFAFLGKFGPDAAGHETGHPQVEVALLERFSEGKCNARERQNVCDMLRLHPDWLRWLADRVKRKRLVE